MYKQSGVRPAVTSLYEASDIILIAIVANKCTTNRVTFLDGLQCWGIQ